MSVDAESLRTFAEVAAGFVGFAAVSTGLAANRPGGLSAFDKIRFYWIVSGGLSIIGLSFVPIWVSIFDSENQMVWYTSTLVVCACIPPFVLMIFLPMFAKGQLPHTIGKKGPDEKRWLLNSYLFSLVLSITIVQNLASWPVPANQATYEFMLIIALSQMAYNFVNLVVVRGSEGVT